MAIEDLRTDIEADTKQKDPGYEHHEQHNEVNTAVLDHEDRITTLESGGTPDLVNHLNDTDDAHNASAISTSGATPSNVQTELDDHDERIGTLEGVDNATQVELEVAVALLEGQIGDAVATHTQDPTDAHDASAISTSGATPSNVQAELDDLDSRVTDHVDDTEGAHLASAIATEGATPSNVQAELDDIRSGLNGIDGITPTKGNLLVGNGTDWVPLGVGTDDKVLMADAAESTGVKWSFNTAANITVTPVGEMTADDVQEALEDLTERTAVRQMIRRNREYMIIEEDFVGGDTPAINAAFGLNRWFVPAAASIAPGITQNVDRQVVSLNPSTLNNWTGMHLNLTSVRLTPVFYMHWWGRKGVVDDGSHQGTTYAGLQNTCTNASPNAGIWFQQDGTGGAGNNWYLGRGNGTAVTTDTGIDADDTWREFSIECDDTNVIYGIDKYLGTYESAPISTDLPSGLATRFGPAFQNIKVLGTGSSRTFQIDTFLMIFERP